MSEKYRKGEYTNCRYDICEIVDGDGDVFCTVATEDADLVIGVLNENMQLKDDLKKKFVPFARADENGITKVDTDSFIEYMQEINELRMENIRLKQELFEVEKAYLIETTDENDEVVDLEKEIEELRKEIFDD